MRDDPWSKLGPSTEQLVGQRVGGQHALDIYWIKSADGAPGLLLRGIDAAGVPESLPKPRGLTLDVNSGQDALEARMFLREPEDRDVFLTLCRDVISCSAIDASVSTATASVFRRLSHWHSLMTRARTTAMDPHEVRGLIGELHVLERLMLRGDVGAALRAWVAPDDHPQDFVVDERIVEVKTRLAGARRQVHISSLEQLDAGQTPLVLAVIELVQSDTVDAESLNQVCDRLALIAQSHGVDQEDALHISLIKRGYTRQDTYDASRYRVAGTTMFRVSDEFPRLLRAGIDERIQKASYVLDVSLLEEFRIDDDPLFPTERGA